MPTEGFPPQNGNIPKREIRDCQQDKEKTKEPTTHNEQARSTTISKLKKAKRGKKEAERKGSGGIKLMGI